MTVRNYSTVVSLSLLIFASVGTMHLGGSLGRAGVLHQDGHDDGAALTGMLSYPDLPPKAVTDGEPADPDATDYETGELHLIELGAFVPMQGLHLVFFNGLRRHGGTPPRAPPGCKAADSAYRYSQVHYTGASILEAQGISAIAALRPPPPKDSDKQERRDHGLFVMDALAKSKYVALFFAF